MVFVETAWDREAIIAQDGRHQEKVSRDFTHDHSEALG